MIQWIHVLPPVRLRGREVWLASLVCGGAWLIVTQAMALSAIFFGANISAYSAVGSVLVVMLWIGIVNQVLFYGAELCKVIHLRDEKLARARLDASQVR